MFTEYTDTPAASRQWARLYTDRRALGNAYVTEIKANGIESDSARETLDAYLDVQVDMWIFQAFWEEAGMDLR